MKSLCATQTSWDRTICRICKGLKSVIKYLSLNGIFMRVKLNITFSEALYHYIVAGGARNFISMNEESRCPRFTPNISTWQLWKNKNRHWHLSLTKNYLINTSKTQPITFKHEPNNKMEKVIGGHVGWLFEHEKHFLHVVFKLAGYVDHQYCTCQIKVNTSSWKPGWRFFLL